MKRFLLKVVLLICIVLSLVKIVDIYYKTTNEYINLLTEREIVKFDINNSANEIKEEIKFIPLQKDLQIINLGSSHGRASFNYIDFEEYNTFNFGLSLQSPKYDYLILDYYKDYLNEDAIVFIPISYYTLYYNEFDDFDTFESLNVRYYDILGINHIQNIDIAYYITNKISPLLLLENKEIYEALFNQQEEINIFNEKWYTRFNDFDIETQTDIINATAEYHYILIGNQTLNTDTVLVYKEIIDLCKSEGFYPVLVTTPYLKEYNDEFNEEFYNKFYQDINKIVDENNVLYLDYSHNTEFANNKEYFADTDHLNELGSEIFTNTILQEVFAKINK